MKKLGQKGFTVFEVVLLIIILAVIVAGGYYIYHRDHSVKPVDKLSQNTHQQTSATKNSEKSYLVIKQWGVKLKLSGPIKDATYQIVTNNKYLKPSAFLSTSKLDASASCKSYYTKDADPQNPQPSFQFIERFALNDKVPMEDSPTISAQQAVKKYPQDYKQVGNYVYGYNHGNGMPCELQTAAEGGAFESAFATISKS